jgi:hypothetical protein
MTLNLSRDADWSDFLTNFIPDKLFNYVMLNLNEEKVSSLDEYLYESLKINSSSTDVIEYGLKNLFISDTGSEFIVMIDSTLFMPKTNQNLLNLIKLIDYGNLEVKGLNIISEAFSYIVMQIQNLVKLYKLTTRGGT